MTTSHTIGEHLKFIQRSASFASRRALIGGFIERDTIPSLPTLEQDPSRARAPRHTRTHSPLYAHHITTKMAAIVASNFAVAAPVKVAARKISSRRAALPGTCERETHRAGETNNFIRASRTRRGRAETIETRAALDVSGFASDSRPRTDRRPPIPHSTTVKRSVSVKAVRKQQVVARCVRWIENPSRVRFQARDRARVDARVRARASGNARARPRSARDAPCPGACRRRGIRSRARGRGRGDIDAHATEVSPDRSFSG